MHITLQTEELKRYLSVLDRVSTKHSTLPVLACVHITVAGDTAQLHTTNLEVGVEVSLTGSDGEDGAVAVLSHTLLQTIELIKEKTVTLHVEGDMLSVGVGEKNQTTIKTIADDEFPKIPELSSGGVRISRELFALGVKTVAFAASQSSIKPELGSVYCYQKKEQTLTFVATDSFRLMEKTVPQKGVVLDEGVMFPHKNALEIVRIFDMEEGDPEMIVSENQCAFRFDDGLYVTTRLTTGSFPDYEQIIPKEYVTNATVLRDDLQHVFKKTSIFLNKFLQVKLHISGNTIACSAESGEVGMATESVSAEVTGDDLTLSFNQRYIESALTHFGDDSVVLKFAGVGRPMVMVGTGDVSVRYLVMPMNK